MTINEIWKWLIPTASGIAVLFGLFEKLIKPRLIKLKEYKDKINRGAKLDDQYEEDHQIIIEMSGTLKSIDKRIDEQSSLLTKDYILTLRNTIMNENLTHEERLEAYLDYKHNGGNGEVKKYAEKYLIKKEVK